MNPVSSSLWTQQGCSHGFCVLVLSPCKILWQSYVLLFWHLLSLPSFKATNSACSSSEYSKQQLFQRRNKIFLLTVSGKKIQNRISEGLSSPPSLAGTGIFKSSQRILSYSIVHYTLSWHLRFTISKLFYIYNCCSSHLILWWKPSQQYCEHQQHRKLLQIQS